MRHLARIGLVAAFAACAFVGGCNKSARVENSASATKTCEGTGACTAKSAECTEAKSAGCCAGKTEAAQGGACPAAKSQN